MVNRFLSMNSDWMELVNELQKYNLQPKKSYINYIQTSYQKVKDG